MKIAHATFLFLSVCCAAIAREGEDREQQVGGACEYQRIHGRAAIEDVRAADPNANNCKDAVEVVFTFIPNEPSAPKHYRFPDHPDTGRRLHLGAGMNPPREWVRTQGLVKGAVFRCVRSELLKGACTPVVFTFPDLDTKGWEKTCFE